MYFDVVLHCLEDPVCNESRLFSFLFHLFLFIFTFLVPFSFLLDTYCILMWPIIALLISTALISAALGVAQRNKYSQHCRCGRQRNESVGKLICELVGAWQ